MLAGMQKPLILVLTVMASSLAYGQRHITFNGKPLTAEQEKRLEAVEREHGVRLPDRDYWYDNRSDARLSSGRRTRMV